MKRILVVGASSLIGFHLAVALRRRYHVFGTYASRRPRIDEVPCFQLPLTRHAPIDSLVGTLRPDAIVYCPGEASAGKCQADPLGTLFVNGEAASSFARARPTARLLFLSSSKVFSGTQGDYAEDSPTDGTTLYGKGKLQGEDRLQEFPNAVSLRLGTVLGLGPFPDRSPLNRLLSHLWNRQTLPLIEDEYRSFYLVDELVPALEAVLERTHLEPGPYHVTAGEKDSHYSFGRKVAAALGLDDSVLIPVSGETFHPPANGAATTTPRGRDLSLRSKTFTSAFGYRLRRLESSLGPWAARLSAGTQ